jgi:hypothetical protein
VFKNSNAPITIIQSDLLVKPPRRCCSLHFSGSLCLHSRPFYAVDKALFICLDIEIGKRSLVIKKPLHLMRGGVPGDKPP